MYEKNLMSRLGHDAKAPQSFTPKFAAVADLISSFNRYHRIGFWEYNTSDRSVNWSRETFAIHGLDHDEGIIPYEKALEFYIQEDVPHVAEILKKAIAARQGFHFKQRIRRVDGEIRVVEVIGDTKEIGPEKNVVLFGTFRDITSQTRFENMRVGQQDLIGRLIKSIPIPAVIMDNKLRYISINDRFSIEFNMKKSDMPPLYSYYDMFPDMPDRWREMIKLALGGQQVGREKDTIERPNGVKYLMDWVLQPWTTQSGETGGLVALIKVHRIFPPIMPDNALSDMSHAATAIPTLPS